MWKNKYNAVRTLHPDGSSFPSKLEAAVYSHLKMLERCNLLSDIKKQRCVKLGEDTRWKIDFSFMQDGELVYAEAKGVATNDYLRKLKLFKKYGKWPLKVYMGSYQKPVLIETVYPAGYNKQRIKK